MAFRFCDSFDHYASPNMSQKWTSFIGVAIGAGAARNGPQGLVSTGGGSVSKTLDYQTTWIAGFAMFMVNVGSGLTSSGIIHQILSCGTKLASVRVNADGTMSLCYGSSDTQFALAAIVLSTNTWYYIEIKHVIGASGGNVATTATLRVNGITVATGSHDTGIATASLVNPINAANRHIIGGVAGNPSDTHIDDVYICDGQSGINNDFLGDVAIAALYPDADNGVNFSLSPAAPTTHYTHVNEEPPDGDTSYIYSSTVGQTDDFLWQNIATFAGTVPAVQYLLYARKDDEGTRTIQHTIGGNTYAAGTGGVLGTPQFSLSDNYVYYHIPLDVDPAAGSAAWTVANFNAQDFGVKVAA